VLDTHVFIWRAIDPDRISAAANDAIDDPSNEVWISSASAWEIATKHRIGKLEQGAAIIGSFAQQVRMLRATELAVTIEHGLVAGGFDVTHRDPFDRMLAAQALVEGAVLVTSDRALTAFPITTIW
jgi:PIN domain nuclease of toxin-antitoxin system